MGNRLKLFLFAACLAAAPDFACAGTGMAAIEAVRADPNRAYDNNTRRADDTGSSGGVYVAALNIGGGLRPGFGKAPGGSTSARTERKTSSVTKSSGGGSDDEEGSKSFWDNFFDERAPEAFAWAGGLGAAIGIAAGLALGSATGGLAFALVAAAVLGIVFNLTK